MQGDVCVDLDGLYLEAEYILYKDDPKGSEVIAMNTFKRIGMTVIGMFVTLLAFSACSSAIDAEDTDPTTRIMEQVFPGKTELQIAALPMDTLIEKVNSNSEVSPSQKIDILYHVARIHTTQNLDPAPFLNELKYHFSTNAIVENNDPLFLLRQVYVGAYLDIYYPDTRIESEIGFDYYQIARDLYRGNAVVGDDSTNANLEQIRKSIGSV